MSGPPNAHSHQLHAFRIVSKAFSITNFQELADKTCVRELQRRPINILLESAHDTRFERNTDNTHMHTHHMTHA